MVNFGYDITSRAVGFEPVRPAGSLIYAAADGGYINVAGDRDTFEMHLSAGETIAAVAVGEAPGAALTFELFGATGVLATAMNIGSVSLAPVSVPSDGVYLLRVGGYSPTAYSLDLYRNAVVEFADTDDGSELAIDYSHMDLGSGRCAVVGNIGADEIDEFTIDLTGMPGESIDVILGTGAELFDGEMILLDIDGATELARAVNDPLGTIVTNYEQGILNFVVPADGVYTIRLTASGQQQSSAYAIVVAEDLAFDTEPNSNRSNFALRKLDNVNGATGFLSVSTVAVHSTVAVYTQDTERVTPLQQSEHMAKLSQEQYDFAKAGGFLRERVRFVPPAYDPGVNPHAYWFVFEDWFSPSSDMDFEDVQIFVEELTDTQLRLTAFLGSVSLSHDLILTSGETLISGITSSPQVVHVDSETYPSDVDSYMIHLTAGEALTVTTATPGDGQFGWNNALDPGIKLYAPDGSLATSGENGAPDGRNAILSRVVNTSGVYEVRIHSSEGTVGEYVLNVTTHSPSVANPIADVTVDEDAETTVLDLSSVFEDDDPAHSLPLWVTGNSNTGLVNTSVVGASLSLYYVADANGQADITVRATDQTGAWVTNTFTVTVNPVVDVVGRHVLYNNSAFGDAIDPNKTPLLPGGVISSANYTGYWGGVNGVAIDIDALPPGDPEAGDFGIRVNEAANPDTWSVGPAPAVSFRPGEGVGGYDRVTLIWGDGAILNQWVEVTVLATANTGLAADDVFYFANIVGDCDGDGEVGASDYGTLAGEFGLRGGVGELAADLNGDGRVGLTDFAIMRGAIGNSVSIPTFPAAAPEAVVESGLGALAVTARVTSVNPGAASDRSTVISNQLTANDPAAAIDLLGGLLSVGGYVAEPRAVRPTRLQRAATSAYDLKPLRDDPAGDAPGDDLLADVLEEAVLPTIGSQLTTDS
ncbi:MAG: hypothetical protein QGH60_22170 [Phycisphaerae bacterium]|nr:hypothetical protein [Phycisphaerae bacterium]